MSSGNQNEVQKKYEKEFCEILMQKINHAGGSLQFQHLSGLLQQLPFEIKDAFGTTKSELMKFLRGKPNIFKIDSKGVVSVVSSISFDSHNNATESVAGTSANAEKTLLPKIDNGKGKIVKISPEFAIIKASKPKGTLVYFTPLEYGASKDSLFTIDIDLWENSNVYFNAIHGHKDYEIEYRATKVWRKCDSDEEFTNFDNFKNHKNTHEIRGEGVIKELSHESGVILTLDEKSETVLFYKNIVKNCDIHVFLKVGDHVEFTAVNVKKNSKTLWQATEVKKKMKKSPKQLHTDSETSDKINLKCDNVKNKIENEHGKIYPYSHGAIIKFGMNYSELADGDSSDYFLYGSKVVSDISWEFSEGDDVQFDAVKTKKKPGWKAILVWIGEKPTCFFSGNRKNIDEDRDEVIDDQNFAHSSDFSLESSNSPVRSKQMKSKFSDLKMQNESKSDTSHEKLRTKSKSDLNYDHSVSRKLDRSQKEYKKNNSVTSNTIYPPKSFKNSKYKKANNRPVKENLPIGKYKPSRENLDSELSEISNSVYKSCSSLHSSSEAVSDIDISEESKNSSEEDKELVQSVSQYFKKYLKEEGYEHPQNTLMHTSTNFLKDEIASENKNITSEIPKSYKKKKASIKTFENIEGEVIRLHCKIAIIRSSCLQQEVDFVLNTFYLNKKSVEEQQIDDLKEVLNIGDIVHFNCFEITDDFGKIWGKVTVAWRGPKPMKVYEITPEEFISEQELIVSVCDDIDIESMPEKEASEFLLEQELSSSDCDKLDIECVSESKLSEPFVTSDCDKTDSECILENKAPQSFLALMNSSDMTFESPSETKSTLNNTLDNASSRHFTESTSNEICENLNDSLSANVHHKSLCRKIIQRLKSYGVISSDTEVDLNVIHKIITLVLKESDIEECHHSIVNEGGDMPDASKILCTSCTKRGKFVSSEVTTKHAEAQTISTGEICSTSIYTQS